jgi:general secretion pathway protein D
MNSDAFTRRVAAAVLIVLLFLGPVAAIGKNGRKFFREGVRLERSEKWDQAAEQFALALNEEPDNTEYLVHYRRSLVKASLAFMDLGKHFEESKDWASAFNSYRQAYSYDPANEEAKTRMKVILDLRGIPNNNGIPTEQPFSEKSVTDIKYTSDGKRAYPDSRKPKVVLPPSDIAFQKGTQLRQVIQSLARTLNLNVLFDEAFKDAPLKDPFELRGETAARALDLFLLTNKLFYAQVGTRTIVVSSDSTPNRNRYQDMFVKTFYVKNADVAEVSRLIQAQLGTKGIGTAKNLNAIVVRETAPNMQVIESIISALDKTPAEVLIDVNMYEIAHSDMIQIGNQFATDGSNIPSLSSLGHLFAPQSAATTNSTTGQRTLSQELRVWSGPALLSVCRHPLSVFCKTKDIQS